jgi:hypothetical protein
MGRTAKEEVDRELNIAPNHTYFRAMPQMKFWAGFGLGYLVLREIPVRNFYARIFIMGGLFAKLYDHAANLNPFNLDPRFMLHTKDSKFGREGMAFDEVRNSNIFQIPTGTNQIRESKLWEL